ncbi:MAG: hypothetical protein ACPIOQ_22085 [Promethearchaeia archaeon]
MLESRDTGKAVSFATLARDLPILLQRARAITAAQEMGMACQGENGALSVDKLDVWFAAASRREAAAREQLSDFLAHFPDLTPGQKQHDSTEATEETDLFQRIRTGLVQLDQRMWDIRCVDQN